MAIDCARCPLRRLDVFATLDSAGLAFLQKFKVGELVVERGAPILMEGSSSPQLYTTLEGMGLRYKILPDGQRQVVNFVMPGDFLGLQAGVMGTMRHSVDAATPMVLCVFDRAHLWDLFRNQPERAFDLTWLASIQEHFLGEALASVGQMNAQQRICWGLLRVFLRAEALGLTDRDVCPFPFTQQDLADALGLSVVHTNKTLKSLRERQILTWQDGTLQLHDMAQIREIALLEVSEAGERPLI